MAKVDFGLEELLAMEQRTLEAAAGRAVLDAGLRRLGMLLLRRAKQLSGAYVKTGHLRRSWFTETDGQAVYLENPVYYAAYVNYGHRVVRGGRTVGFVPPAALLERALQQTAQYDLARECARMTADLLKEFHP